MPSPDVPDARIDGPWRHVDVRANGARFHLAVGRHFSSADQLVLLLHGFPEFWYAWRAQLPALDAAGYAVAALDLRGYGGSDQTPQGYGPGTSAADLAGVIEVLGHRRAVLVGHDWGGMAAWFTAAYAPRHVRALAMIAAPHPLAFPWRQNWRELVATVLPVLPERRLQAHDGAYVERLLRRRAGPGTPWPTVEDARIYRAALQHWPAPRCAVAAQRAYVRSARDPDLREALRAGVRVPLLSVHGADDPVLPRASMVAAERFVEGRHHLVDLPGVGHYPHEEAPDSCTDALLQWLATLA